MRSGSSGPGYMRWRAYRRVTGGPRAAGVAGPAGCVVVVGRPVPTGRSGQAVTISVVAPWPMLPRASVALTVIVHDAWSGERPEGSASRSRARSR